VVACRWRAVLARARKDLASGGQVGWPKARNRSSPEGKSPMTDVREYRISRAAARGNHSPV
jgi:hypothetical protein